MDHIIHVPLVCKIEENEEEVGAVELDLDGVRFIIRDDLNKMYKNELMDVFEGRHKFWVTVQLPSNRAIIMEMVKDLHDDVVQELFDQLRSHIYDRS